MGYKDIKKKKKTTKDQNPTSIKKLFGTKSSMGDPGTNWNQPTEQGPTADTLILGLCSIKTSYLFFSSWNSLELT